MSTDPSQAKSEYWELAGLWRFYLDLLIKANLFYAGIAGGLSAYVLRVRGQSPEVDLALLVPLVLAAGFCVMSARGVWQALELKRSMDRLAKDASLVQPVHAGLLWQASAMTAIYYLLSVVGIILILSTGHSDVAPDNT